MMEILAKPIILIKDEGVVLLSQKNNGFIKTSNTINNCPGFLSCPGQCYSPSYYNTPPCPVKGC